MRLFILNFVGTGGKLPPVPTPAFYLPPPVSTNASVLLAAGGGAPRIGKIFSRIFGKNRNGANAIIRDPGGTDQRKKNEDEISCQASLKNNVCLRNMLFSSCANCSFCDQNGSSTSNHSV